MSSQETRKDFIREIVSQDLASGKHQTVVTRFPPEPNGYLHIGHAKAISISFGIADEVDGGVCHLRFDDTNPSKESTEYVRSIIEDVKWLGYDWGQNLFYASDYFSYFYEQAVKLIETGKAYVDKSSLEAIREMRGSVKVAGVDSPYRDTSPAENLALFEQMKNGEMAEGECVLRAKIDMSSPNMNLRDPVIYRVMNVEHHRTGSDWHIYPMYDFAHPLEDAKELITHSLCSLEFEDHRPLYEWVNEESDAPSRPRQIEFSRLSLTYTVMSKRKLLQLVEEKVVHGWDDPRLPTLSGMRRRGYTPAAIRALCEKVGVTKFNGTTDMAVLEFEVRQDLNRDSDRRMAVLDPLKVVITNWEESREEQMTVLNHPENEAVGTREVPLTREIYIEREDFMIDPPRKFFRLGPGRSVRLRGAYIMTCTGYEACPDTGEVLEVHVEYLPDTVGQSPPEGVKCKAAIHWVSVKYAVDLEVRLYDRLFEVENPDAEEHGFMNCLNENSLVVLAAAKGERSLAEVPAGYRCQFERLGYFCADARDHSSGQAVFNKTVGLKDSWSKKK